MLRSRSAVAFICRTSPASKSRSIRVLLLETASRVVEYNDLVGGLPDRRVIAEHPGSSGRVCAVSQETIASYIRRPVQVRADRPLEVVDEGMHRFVRAYHVEVAVVVRHVAVEGRNDGGVDQLPHVTTARA